MVTAEREREGEREREKEREGERERLQPNLLSGQKTPHPSCG